MGEGGDIYVRTSANRYCGEAGVRTHLYNQMGKGCMESLELRSPRWAKRNKINGG